MIGDDEESEVGQFELAEMSEQEAAETQQPYVSPRFRELSNAFDQAGMSDQDPDDLLVAMRVARDMGEHQAAEHIAEMALEAEAAREENNIAPFELKDAILTKLGPDLYYPLLEQLWPDPGVKIANCVAYICDEYDNGLRLLQTCQGKDFQELLLQAHQALTRAGVTSVPNDFSRRAPEPDVSITGRMAAQRRINELHELFPTDSAEYKTARVQSELQDLYERVYGGGGVVGRNGRVV
jgi:hypothetical protein